MYTYCWDLDRTYLDTDIHSMRGMVRAALEDASEKRNIPGSATLLRHLLRFEDARALVLSGSPTQLRGVLAKKLALDGIAFERLVLKDNLRNIRRGRLKAVRGQVGYKLPHLFAQRVGRSPVDLEILFGDDSEADALVYSLYAEAIAGRVTADVVSQVMSSTDAYDDQIERALRDLGEIRSVDAVRAIFIHVDRYVPLATFQHLGPKVHVVFSWFQAALGLWALDRLSADGVAEVAHRCIEVSKLSDRQVVALVQDAVRRGLVSSLDVERFLQMPTHFSGRAPACRRGLELLGDPPTPATPSAPNWSAFITHMQARD